jgi:hypothetical protein
MMKLIALHLVLVRWSRRWSDRFLSIVGAPAWTRMMAILLRLPDRWFSPIRTLCCRFPAWWDRSLTIVGSIDWLRLKVTVSRWLRQPYDPTRWRLLDSRLFEGMFRFNNKKI